MTKLTLSRAQARLRIEIGSSVVINDRKKFCNQFARERCAGFFEALTVFLQALSDRARPWEHVRAANSRMFAELRDWSFFGGRYEICLRSLHSSGGGLQFAVSKVLAVGDDLDTCVEQAINSRGRR